MHRKVFGLLGGYGEDVLGNLLCKLAVARTPVSAGEHQATELFYHGSEGRFIARSSKEGEVFVGTFGHQI